MTSFALRQLSDQERRRVFGSTNPRYDPQAYVDTVREMEGGVAYGIPINGVSPRATRVRLGKAAKSLGLTLRWGKATDAEIYVELGE